MNKLEQESQQELFEEFSGSPEHAKPGPLQFLSRSQRPILISTNSEQLVLVSIIAILVCCFVFFLGVLKGKSVQPAPGTRSAAPLNSKPRAPQTLPTTFSTQGAAQTAKNVVKAAPEATAGTKASGSAQIMTDLNKPYTIQLCTYRGSSLAEKEVALLRKKGYYSFIIPSGDYYQVCVGQYVTKEHAKKDLKAFGAVYKGCFLRRR